MHNLTSVPDELSTEQAEAIARAHGACVSVHSGVRLVAATGEPSLASLAMAESIERAFERAAKLAGRVGLALALLVAPALARAEQPRQAQPVVCSDFRTFESPSGSGKTQVVGACFDGKRPAIWSTWQILTVTDPDGKPRRIAVGFR